MSRKQMGRRGVWYKGGRKRRCKQKGGFLLVASIFASLAGPALGVNKMKQEQN